MTEQTLTERHPYWAYIITSILASFGALLIHSHSNDGIDWNIYFMWLPVVWLIVLVFAFVFGLVITTKKKANS